MVYGEVTASSRLYGGDGADALRVWGGTNNRLAGGAGDDTIIGGAKRDLVIGGAGADRLAGGAGPDDFVLRAVADSRASARDQILDWDARDRIDLSAIDARPGVAGDQGFAFVGTAPGGAGQVWVEERAGDTLILADTGGGGRLSIRVADGAAHSAADWVTADFLL